MTGPRFSPWAEDPGVRVAVLQGRETTVAFRRHLESFLGEAFGEDVAPLLREMSPVAHVVTQDGSGLLSHAMWVDRWLAVGSSAPLRTAYVEFVATRPDVRLRGLGRAVMTRLVEELEPDYPLAALCTGTPDFYRRMGWRVWDGDLLVRHPSGRLEATPDEIVMLLDRSGELGDRWDQPLSVEWRPGEVW